MVKEIVKYVDKTNQYKDSKGKMRDTTNYYIVLNNGNSIAFKPSFSRDYPKLEAIARVVIKDKNK